MGLFALRVDARKNRFILKVTGLFAESELSELSSRIQEASRELHAGFDVINDVSRCLPVTPDGVLIIMEMQKRLKAAGVNRVIRVVDEAVVPNLQLSLHAKEVGYHAVTAKSVEEAERLLDGKEPSARGDPS
jgi:hypothetical protein